jgi:hypothetical protein
VGPIRIGFDAGLANRLAQRTGRLIDERVMHGTLRCVCDAMSSGLEESDLGTSRATPDCKPRAMTMPMPSRLSKARHGKVGSLCEPADDLPGTFRRLIPSEAGAAGAGGAMWASS